MATAKALAKPKVKPRPPQGRFHFDPKRAERVISFVQCLKHTKGKLAGHAFILDKWERKFVEDVFGWLDEHGNRRYRVAFLEVPCKNGKSTFAAAIMLYLLCADGEQGAEIYSAALNRDQAAIVFAEAKAMVMQSPELRAATTIYENKADWRIDYHATHSFYRVLTGKASSNEGWNAHGFAFDELHTQPDRSMYDVSRKRMGARSQPLMLITTTAGFDRTSVAWEVHEYATKLLAGEIQDDNFYAMIYSAAEGAAWDDEKVWFACNPALKAGYKNLDIMRADAREAKLNPSLENTFRRYQLNQWTRSDVRAIASDKWDACGGSIDLDQFRGVPGYLAIECAARFDIAAVAVCWRLDGLYYLTWKFYIPGVLSPRLKPKAELYRAWVAGGWITETPGDAIDQSYIEADVVKFNQDFRIEGNFYDPYNATQLYTNLGKANIELIEHQPGLRFMSSPTKEFLVAVATGKIRHGDNPVAAWMAGNLMTKEDSRGNIIPIKGAELEKIDGMIAAIMAFGRASIAEEIEMGDYEKLAAGIVKPWYDGATQ
jgi:phage terminase large subunit-like protein